MSSIRAKPNSLYEIARLMRKKHRDKLPDMTIDGITIVRTKAQAQQVIQILKKYPTRVHAWDMEKINIDLKIESPVMHGELICASCFLGPEVDFGNGPRLFVDSYKNDLILEFKEYFEDAALMKCWHNYSCDRHIFFNHGIDVQGFSADTKHMALLADPSLLVDPARGDSSLAALSSALAPELKLTRDAILNKLKLDGSDIKIYEDSIDNTMKTNLKNKFNFYKEIENNEKILVFPDSEEMHTTPEYARTWVKH